jgi:LPS-assembly protein
MILTVALFLAAVSGSRQSLAQETSLDRGSLGNRKSQWQISAEKITYDNDKKLYIAEGDVVITNESQKLTAKRALYNEESGIVQVSGDVRLTANGDILTGETGLLDLENRVGQITRGSMFLRENHCYIEGSTIVKTGPNTYLVKDCRITTCDGERPDWSVTGKEVDVAFEGYGTVKNAAFRVKDFPVFYLPYAIFPVKSERQTGFLPPRLGYSSLNGAEMELPFFWAISESMDATFYERYMAERGLMQGLEMRYVAKEDSRGTFLLDVMRDKIKEKDFDDPDQAELSPFERTNQTRYWFRGRMDHTLAPGLEARLDTDFVSDQDYMKEFRGSLFGLQARPDLSDFGRPVEDHRSPTRRSALRLSHDGQEYSLQARSAYYQRPEDPDPDDATQPLAGLNFALLPRPLAPELPFFMGVDTSYDYIWRDFGEKGHRLFLGPRLFHPMWFGRYLKLETSLDYEHVTQWVDGDPGWSGTQSKNAYHARAELSTALEKVFDVEWGDLTGFKHKITPTLAYDFRRYKDKDTRRPWFEPIDTKGDINTVTMGVENILVTKRDDQQGGVRYNQWGKFTLSQGYDIEEARRHETPGIKKRPWKPLAADLSLSPSSSLDLDAAMRWDHYESDIVYSDISLDFFVDRKGGKKDRFSLEYNYNKDQHESMGYRVEINLPRGFAVGSTMDKDMELDHTIESRHWVDYQSQCWGVRLSTESAEGIDSVMVEIRLLGLSGPNGIF